MSNAPKYNAYTVKDRGPDKKSIWTRIGVAWSQKGDGLTLDIEALPLNFDGKIILLPPKSTPSADTFEGEVQS